MAPCSIYCQAAYIKCASGGEREREKEREKERERERASTSIIENKSWKRDEGGREELRHCQHFK